MNVVETKTASSKTDKSGVSASDSGKEISPEGTGEYFIPTKVGKSEDVIEGLLHLANDLLKVGGRLVYLFPIDRYK